MRTWHVLALLPAAIVGATASGDEPSAKVAISAARREADGTLVHRVACPYQAGETEVRVLLPTTLRAGHAYPVVYILPVEAGRESRYGDGLATAREMKAADRFGVVCVAPTFSQLPWYADHPTDPAIRQESYFLQVVVPLVEREYPVEKSRSGRRLLGFSKSGWGAWSLALRHPELFGAAASWDAPLTMDAPGKYGSGPIFGTKENFAKYQVTQLLEQAASASERTPRLILLGYGNFTDHRAIHEQLQRLRLAHAYRDGPQSEHIWSAAWMEPALEQLTK